MTSVEVLRAESDLAFAALLESIGKVDQPLAWARAQLVPGAYLHSNGTIIGIVQHIALCKYGHSSTAFPETKMRLRDSFGEAEQIGVDWESSIAFLKRSQEFFLNCWNDIAASDLATVRKNVSGRETPTWRLIATMTQHDAHHTGQIELLASMLQPTDTPPDMDYDGERSHLVNLPNW